MEAATKLTDLAYPQSDWSLQGLGAGASFFFWVRLVDRTGNIGPWFPGGNGVLGQSGSDAAPVLALIAGQIGETELSNEIIDRIDLIDGDGPGSVNERIGILRDEISDLVDALEYDPGKPYLEDDAVRLGQRLYQAKQPVPSDQSGANSPPNPLYWLDIGQVVQTANGLALQVSKNTADITVLDGVVTAQAASTQAIRAAWRDEDANGDLASSLNEWGAEAGIAEQRKALATEHYATAERLFSMDAKVGSNASGLATLEKVVATQDAASASRFDTLKSTVDGQLSTIQQLSEAQSNQEGSIGSLRTVVQATASSARDDDDNGDLASAVAQWQGTASVEVVTKAQADTNGKLSTMWAVKMQVNNNGQMVTAGVGLGIEANAEGVLQSQFLVSADRFAVVGTLAGGQVFTPFVVQNGQVFMSSAFIQDGTITNAKIGEVISSSNYVSGVQGWAIYKNGLFEMNGTGEEQTRFTINNTGVKGYHANGVLGIDLSI